MHEFVMLTRRLDPPERATLVTLYQYNIAISPDSFAANFPIRESDASEIFTNLEKSGYLRKTGAGPFELTDVGESYVEEKIEFRTSAATVS